jgi:hypothetical protein
MTRACEDARSQAGHGRRRSVQVTDQAGGHRTDLPFGADRWEHLMSADPDLALVAASIAFAGAAVAGSAVAIREQLAGQPCGISVPLSVPAGLLAGWGAGVAAPWPMPVAAVIAAARSHRTEPSALTGGICAGIGLGCVLGTAIEPVTRRPRAWSPAARLAIVVNLAASAALIVVGGRHLAGARRSGDR